MTPEAAHAEGKRIARKFVAPGRTPDVKEIVDFAALLLGSQGVTPLHVRGAADYFRELAGDLEASAAALEATR